MNDNIVAPDNAGEPLIEAVWVENGKLRVHPVTQEVIGILTNGGVLEAEDPGEALAWLIRQQEMVQIGLPTCDGDQAESEFRGRALGVLVKVVREFL